MYNEDYTAVSNSAAGKVGFLKKNPIGYFVQAMLAGVYVGFGNLLANAVAGALNGSEWTKIMMGAVFGVALSLVVMAGAELFTGNNMAMAMGISRGKVTVLDAIKLWIVCWIGNWVGGIVLSLLFTYTGLCNEAMAASLAAGAVAKVSAPILQLIIRGILCNVLVCLAVWACARCKSESGKLIMIFWCLFTFVILGFEHCVANMTQLTMALLSPAGPAISIGGYFYNLFFVTIGNIIGGVVFVAGPYYLAAKKD